MTQEKKTIVKEKKSWFKLELAQINIQLSFFYTIMNTYYNK